MKRTMKRTLKTITILSLAAVLLMGGSVSAFAASGKTISKTKAKQVALKKAKVKSSSVKKWIKVKLDNWDDDGDREWDVEFQTSKYRYEVEVNARTGRVEDYEKKAIKKATVTKAKAKAIALKRAGVKSSAVKKWTKVKLDDNEWEIKFQTKTHKYEVEINARTGRVKDFEKKKIPVSSAKYIGTDKAKSIALNHAKKHETIKGKVYYTKAKLDHDDGIWVYEIEFKNGWYEFEYEINAKTGKILDWDIEYDD